MNNGSNINNNNNDDYIITRSITFTDIEVMVDNIASMDEDHISGIQTKEEANEVNQTTLTKLWQNEKGSKYQGKVSKYTNEL